MTSRLILLLPALAKFAGQTLPVALGKALARAERTTSEVGETAQLLRNFDALPRAWPHAALARVADAGLADARLGTWLRADPAHLRADINGVRLLGIGRTVGIDANDVEALLPALRPLFGDAGMTLDAPHPERWYLRLAPATRLPGFAAPEQALGDDVFEHTPDAPEARRWRALASEVQIALHNHPHNARRLESGRVPINGLWFWGGGALPDALSSRSPTLYSDDPELRGAAELGKLACMPLAEFRDFDADALVDLRAKRDGAGLVRRWLDPAAAAAGNHEVVLDFSDGRVFSLIRGQRWRFWRKPLQRLAP